MKRILAIFLLLALLLPTIIPLQAQEDYFAETWDRQSRYTVLILGMDRRPNARDTLRVRTDVIMIASIDPQTQQVGILSIPRDMFFQSAHSDEMFRVNTLMVEGEERQEGYGPYFMMDTLEFNFGIYIDAYVAVDFEAFIEIVDMVGGIEVDVPYIIDDPEYPDMNYGYAPFYLPSGRQILDGSTALKYARTRHNDNDYRRGERQLQIIQGIMRRLEEPEIMQKFLAEADVLTTSLEDNVYTDLNLQNIITLGMTVMRYPPDQIRMGALNQDYSYDYPYGNTRVQVPDRNRLPVLMTLIFGSAYWGG